MCDDTRQLGARVTPAEDYANWELGLEQKQVRPTPRNAAADVILGVSPDSSHVG